MIKTFIKALKDQTIVSVKVDENNCVELNTKEGMIFKFTVNHTKGIEFKTGQKRNHNNPTKALVAKAEQALAPTPKPKKKNVKKGK